MAPQPPTTEQLAELKHKYTLAGQDQVFTFYDSLSSTEQASLFQQLSLFDPTYINTIAAKALAPPKPEDGGEAKPSLEPLPASARASIMDSKPEDIDRWYSEGLDLIAANKVAVVLMAGGQGTRLGSSAPKGCFDIGLPSSKSLFQIQGERIRKIEELAAKKAGTGTNVTVPWYVMTSGPTRGPTEQYFKEHNYFGLKPENVVIFEQGVLPCISNDGKILLESKSRVAVAPDGNGGIYNALVESKVLDDMKTRGIEHIHAYCVDNCLVKVADPVFIGFSAAANVDIATKVVRKRNATESVGLIVCKNGKPDVVEYSEIDPAIAAEEDPKQPGVLKFRAANIKSSYAPPSTYAHLPHLPDAIAPNLLILFIGLNPGIQTARTGHAYAHPTNLFWRLLHSSGVTPRLCSPTEDRQMPALYSLGLTNIVSRPSRNGAELSKEEMDAGVEILEEKVRRWRPEVVCVVGKSIWESLWRVRHGRGIKGSEFRYGWQEEGENMGIVEGGVQKEEEREEGVEYKADWKGARIFVATSTSGLAATLKPKEKEEIWRELGEWAEKRRAERAAGAAGDTAPLDGAN